MRKLVSYHQINKIYQRMVSKVEVFFKIAQNAEDEILPTEVETHQTLCVILDLYSHADRN